MYHEKVLPKQNATLRVYTHLMHILKGEEKEVGHLGRWRPEGVFF